MAFEAVQLNIAARDEDFVGAFDLIEVWRSRTDEEGPFEELTAGRWKPARIPKDAGDAPSPAVTGPSVNIVGKELIIRVDEDEENDISVVFTGTDPITFTNVAGQIVTAGLGKLFSYVDSDGVLVIETTEPGTGAALRIVESEAAPLLGLPTEEPASLAFGKDARILLVIGQQSYTFTDKNGSTDYFYKTRFRNKSTSSVSEFSLAFSPQSSGSGVSDENLACGVVDLVGLDGKPLRNVEVRLHSSFDGTIVDDRLVAGQDVVKLTDDTGHVEFILVRGQKVTVAISGTDIVREITVPTDSSVKIFKLLDPSIAGDDVFKVQVPDIVFAERRSL